MCSAVQCWRGAAGRRVRCALAGVWPGRPRSPPAHSPQPVQAVLCGRGTVRDEQEGQIQPRGQVGRGGRCVAASAKCPLASHAPLHPPTYPPARPHPHRFRCLVVRPSHTARAAAAGDAGATAAEAGGGADDIIGARPQLLLLLLLSLPVGHLPSRPASPPQPSATPPTPSPPHPLRPPSLFTPPGVVEVSLVDAKEVLRKLAALETAPRDGVCYVASMAVDSRRAQRGGVGAGGWILRAEERLAGLACSPRPHQLSPRPPPPAPTPLLCAAGSARGRPPRCCARQRRCAGAGGRTRCCCTCTR